MRFILLFLFSISAFAGQMTKADLESCADGRTFYMRGCQGECYDIPADYSCAYSRVKTTKNESESCIDDDECQSKLELKSCIDPEERAIKVLDTDPKEVYCTKTKVMINQGLKTAYDALVSADVAEKQARHDEARVTLKDKLKASQDLSAAELRKVLIHLLGD